MSKPLRMTMPGRPPRRSLVLAAAIASAPGIATAGQPSQCHAGETTLFSCSTGFWAYCDDQPNRDWQIRR